MAAILTTAFLGAVIWSLALLAASRYRSAEGFAQALRDVAIPVSAVLAALTFAFNSAHQRRTLRRDRERLIAETAIGWLGKALELADEVFQEASNDNPLYQAAPSFQIDTIARLLSEALTNARQLEESELVARVKVEADFAGARLLRLLRFRGTAEFFDLRFYKAAHLATGRTFEVAEGASLSLAAYHNFSIEYVDELKESTHQAELPDETKRDVHILGQLVERFRREGKSPFSHPFFGSTVPLASMETILRFALGRPESDVEFAQLLENREAADKWFLTGIYILLFQAKYFRKSPSGKVYYTRDPVQVAEAEAAGAQALTAQT